MLRSLTSLPASCRGVVAAATRLWSLPPPCTTTAARRWDRHESVDLFHGVERGAETNYVDREEKESLRHMLQKIAGLDPAGLESEQRLVELLERFDIVPTTHLRQALMQWKFKGWEDVVKWRAQP